MRERERKHAGHAGRSQATSGIGGASCGSDVPHRAPASPTEDAMQKPRFLHIPAGPSEPHHTVMIDEMLKLVVLDTGEVHMLGRPSGITWSENT